MSAIVDKGGAALALPGGAEGGAAVRTREGISVGTEPVGEPFPSLPRYQPSGTRPPNRGALSHLAPVQEPLAEGFVDTFIDDGRLASCASAVPVDGGRLLLVT